MELLRGGKSKGLSKGKGYVVLSGLYGTVFVD
jgi:hypothetical protein